MFQMILFLVTAPAAHHHHHHEALPASAPADGSIYNLDQTWMDDTGAKVKLASLAGQPLVVAMIYTSCQAACPMIVSDMKRIETALPPAVRTKVRFVLFSFDPERDTQKRMGEYRKERTLPASGWTLLRSGPDEVRDLAAVFGLKYKQLPNKDFQHSNLISVLDADGVIRYQVTGIGEEPAPVVKLIQTLVK